MDLVLLTLHLKDIIFCTFLKENINFQLKEKKNYLPNKNNKYVIKSITSEYFIFIF